MIRHAAPVALLLALTLACGGAADDASDTTAVADDEAAEQSDAGSQPASASGGVTIPMRITLTVSGSNIPGANGTYTATGNGHRCEHDPSAASDTPSWTAHWATDTHPEVKLAHLLVGEPDPQGSSRRFSLQIAVGGGSQTVGHMFSPASGLGMESGGGTVRVTRQGQGATFDFDVAGKAPIVQIRGSITCERLGMAG